jgi:beta-phosphoglucomutase
MTALRAIVFDFDGVLADSEPLHFRALRDCLLAYGIAIDEEEYLRTYLAYDDRGALRIAFERHGLACDTARVEAAARRKAELFDALIRNVPFLPGARELVLGLAREYPLAIASGALRDEIEVILDAGRLRQAFSAIVGAEDVRRGKPDPEPYLAAVTRLQAVAPGLRPEECLAFEDSMPGIASAQAAGMRVVAVTNSYPAAQLGAAHRILPTLAGLESGNLRSWFEEWEDASLSGRHGRPHDASGS